MMRTISLLALVLANVQAVDAQTEAPAPSRTGDVWDAVLEYVSERVPDQRIVLVTGRTAGLEERAMLVFGDRDLLTVDSLEDVIICDGATTCQMGLAADRVITLELWGGEGAASDMRVMVSALHVASGRVVGWRELLRLERCRERGWKVAEVLQRVEI